MRLAAVTDVDAARTQDANLGSRANVLPMNGLNRTRTNVIDRR